MHKNLADRCEAASGADACAKCHAFPLSGFWPRLRAYVAYRVFMALPVPGRRRIYERAWYAILPYAGEWAHSCHCAAALRAKENQNAD